MENLEMTTTAETTNEDSPTEQLFTCKVPKCDKQFSSSMALARHSKNHSDECSYICPVCDVGFFRQDLLTRHMKLHAGKGEQTRQSSTNGRIRKRCHTACDRCRSSKKRCDGRQPCAACQTADKHCKFDKASQRISRVLNRERRTSLVESQGVFNETTLGTVAINSSTIWSQGEGGDGSISLSMDTSSQPEKRPSEMSSSIEDEQINDEDHVLDLTPWPWIHENAFLTDDTNEVMNSIASADIGLPLDLYQDALGAENCRLVPCSDPHKAMEVASALLPTMNDTRSPMGTCTSNLIEETVSRTIAIDPEHAKHQAINSIVRSASQEARGLSNIDRILFWDTVSRKVSQAFQLEFPASTAMDRFLQLYMDRFHPLWPLLSHQNLDPVNLHPYLYLVLSSIGAMYDGNYAKQYGVMMHNSLCVLLCTPLELELDDSGSDLIWLAQARLLTQVAALYFGQTRAFSFAQHLGVLLIAQARKMGLFLAPFYRNSMALFHRMKNVCEDAERLNLWLSIESRKHLAFGIFRGDVFTSATLSTKPLVMLEEIELEFPACRAVWAGKKLEPRQALDIIDHDRTPNNPLPASYIYHIMLDRNEILPPLEPLAHELLLFGLQWPLWRFFHDRDLLVRLTGKKSCEDVCQIPYKQSKIPVRQSNPESVSLETESLDTLSRRMADLMGDRERLLFALGKWERALPMVKTFSQSERDRSFMLSSLILYHVGYMKLLAPIEEIHQIQYHIMNGSPVESTMVRNIMQWANSSQAPTAVSRASSIWTLLDKESSQAPNNRSMVNILAFIGLHHAAALLWAFIGCRRDKTESEWLPLLGFGDSFPCRVGDGESNESRLLQPFIDLYDRINPVGWSSFVEATKMLARNRFTDVISLNLDMDD